MRKGEVWLFEYYPGAWKTGISEENMKKQGQVTIPVSGIGFHKKTL
jgi:hypothetical protein